MFTSLALLSLIILTSTAVDASSIGRRTGKTALSLTRKINHRGALNIVEMDRARVQALTGSGQLEKRSTPQVSVQNAAFAYIAEVGVGTPPINYSLVVDTGSSNIWLGGNKSYVKTDSSQDTGHSFSITYGNGSVAGEEWIDTVTLSPDLIIHQQSIGVASETTNLTGVDGVLGVGPVDLTDGTVSGMDTIPTVMDNLLSQGKISQEVLGIFYFPYYEQNNTGEITFGGYNKDAITSPVTYTPLTTTRNASRYWGIEQSISYGSDIIQPCTTGIVDTATTLVFINSDAFNQYKSKTGAVYDNTTRFFQITPDQYSRLEPLVFHIGGDEFPLIPNAQIWPRSLNWAIGGTSDGIYLVVNDIGPNINSSINFINGYTFLERFYSIYDTQEQRVGLAQTAYTNSKWN